MGCMHDRLIEMTENNNQKMNQESTMISFYPTNAPAFELSSSFPAHTATNVRLEDLVLDSNEVGVQDLFDGNMDLAVKWSQVSDLWREDAVLQSLSPADENEELELRAEIHAALETGALGTKLKAYREACMDTLCYAGQLLEIESRELVYMNNESDDGQGGMHYLRDCRLRHCGVIRSLIISCQTNDRVHKLAIAIGLATSNNLHWQRGVDQLTKIRQWVECASLGYLQLAIAQSFIKHGVRGNV